MTIAGHEINLVSAAVSFESAIQLFSMNKHTEALDIGPAGDSLKTKLAVWGGAAEIKEFRAGLPEVSEYIEMQATEREYPFGPAYDCSAPSGNYMLLEIGDISERAGAAEMELEIAAVDATEMQCKYGSLPFSLSNFAVKGASRKTGESKTARRKGEGWAAFRHGWSRPELSLTLAAGSEAMGGALRWLAETRAAPFMLQCNPPMTLIDGRSEISALCLAWGNLQRVGNSGLWECDFEFAEAV
jgi:hypothetical protein